jgi:sigma-B regulation protein RsbU (phosphoserine phosphatase)
MDTQVGTILVVDDNEMNRDMLSRRLARKGHSVEVAEDGARALEMIEKNDFDLILLDIMMPGIDGYEVLGRLREHHAPEDLPVIMATAKSETEDIVSALKIGANDYVTKPFDFPVVLARVQTQLALKKARDELAAAHRKMKRDLEAAAKIQQTLLPVERPEIGGARCAWRYVPCDELAGDTLNIIPLGGQTVGIYVLDVSGHGVASSLLSVTLSRLMSGTPDTASVLWHFDHTSGTSRLATPVEVANELTKRFPYQDMAHQYFTMIYLTLDIERRCATYVSAGHTALLRLRRGSEPVYHGSTGPPVALVPEILGPLVYEQKEIPLQPGDRLYLYSDGIPEALGPDSEEFGAERLAEALQAVSDEDLDDTLDKLLERIWEWGGGTGPDDDVSIVAIEISA